MGIKEAAFQKGLKTVEAGLQGSLPQKFIDFLWGAVKGSSDEVWAECCTRLALGSTRAGDLVAGDFMEMLGTISHERSVQASIWKVRPAPKEKPDWQGMAQRICDDPDASLRSKEIARNLSERKGGTSAVQGGERYRLQG